MPGAPDGRQIYTVDPDGSDLQQVTHSNFHASGPAWSPDGSRILFWDVLGAGIYVVNEDGSNEVPALASSGTDVTHASWSPYGNRFAFIVNNHEIHAADVGGANADMITDDGFPKRVTDWSPDGTKIAFHSWHGTFHLDIWVVNSDGSGDTRLTDDDCDDITPSWSPLGDRIAWSCDGQIWTMNADGTNKTQLTSPVGTTDYYPAWSPDGQMVAFTRELEGGSDIFVINVDGSGETRITFLPGGDFNPDWQPLGGQSLSTPSPSPTPPTPTPTPVPVGGQVAILPRHDDGSSDGWRISMALGLGGVLMLAALVWGSKRSGN